MANKIPRDEGVTLFHLSCAFIRILSAWLGFHGHQRGHGERGMVVYGLTNMGCLHRCARPSVS